MKEKEMEKSSWYHFKIRESNDVFEIQIKDGKDILQEIRIFMKLVMKDLEVCHVISIKKVSACFGCRNDRPGQREHMAEGGCLRLEEN